MKTEFVSHRIGFSFPGGVGARYQYNSEYDPEQFTDCLEVTNIKMFSSPTLVAGSKLWLLISTRLM